MPRTILRNSALAAAMLASLCFAAMPAIATEANVDVDAGVEDPATPISPSDTHVEVDSGGKDVDVSVDAQPDISVEAPGADVQIDRN